MRVNPNITAPTAARSLADTGNRQQRALERVPAGHRGSRPVDEAVAVTGVDGTHIDATGALQAQRRIQEGISLVQTADGALADVHTALTRMRELVVRADGETPTERAASQTELAALQDDVRRIGERTSFAGQPVFADYSAADQHLVLHLGAHASEPLTALTQNLSLDPAGGGVLAPALQIGLSAGGTRPALDVLDAAVTAVSGVRAGLRDVQDRLETSVASPDGQLDAAALGPLAVATAGQVVEAPATAQLAQAGGVSAALRRQLGS
jgi:flagellin